MKIKWICHKFMLFAFSDNQFIKIFDKSKFSINDDIFISQNFTRYIINIYNKRFWFWLSRCKGTYCTSARNGTDKESYMTHCEKKR